MNIKLNNISTPKNIMLYGGVIFIFLSCYTKLGVLLISFPVHIQVLGLLGFGVCILPLIRPGWMKYVLLIYASSFPLYGSWSYSTHSILFELFLNVLAISVSINLLRNKNREQSLNSIVFLLFSFLILTCFSIVLLPIEDIWWKIKLWDWQVFWNAVSVSTPESELYSIAALWRLILVVLFVVLIAKLENGKELFKFLFLGMLLGAFWSSIIGILEYYSFIELDWYRRVSGIGNRLQSVFANSGWFAEFMAIAIPYILIGIISSNVKRAHKYYLFLVLLVCEVAIILSYSRTGWIIYHIILFICWLVFYLVTQAEKGRIKWGHFGRILIKMLVAVPLTILISYFFIAYVFESTDFDSSEESHRIEKRLDNLFELSTREVIWEGSSDLINNKPLYGYGYESFKYQNTQLDNEIKSWDTAHNLYIQHLVSGGIIGLCLWVCLIFITAHILIVDLLKNKTYLNIAVVLSIIAFHINGLTQSMQYIPMIWLMIFLNIGYALTIRDDNTPQWIRKHALVLAVIITGVLISGFIVYAFDLESAKNVNSKQATFSQNKQNTTKYLGFHPPEDWGEKGFFRWTGGTSIIELEKAGWVSLELACFAPRLDSSPVFVELILDNNILDSFEFEGPSEIKRMVFIPKNSSRNIKFVISRVWSPKKEGINNDARIIGIAISEPKYNYQVIPAYKILLINQAD